MGWKNGMGWRNRDGRDGMNVTDAIDGMDGVDWIDWIYGDIGMDSSIYRWDGWG